MSFIPYAVSWNVTSRCNLNCQHCYLDANGRQWGGPEELSTDEALDVIDQIAGLNPGAVLIFTGGEPLLRPDIYELINAASGKGMMAVLGTNGVLLDVETCGKLKESGLSGVGVSIDSLSQASHDNFRGWPGALKLSMDGLVAAKDVGLSIQVQTTPTSANLGEIPLIAEWAHRMGAKVFNLFFLVCTGRGEAMADITPDDYEKALKWAADERESYPGMMIRPKCAPHFKRILHQENPDNHLLKTYIAACRAGTHYMRIDPIGGVTACPYMDTQAGDLKKEKLSDIWSDSPDFARLRTTEYEGKCGLCKYRMLCGGCRARAAATVGDDMGEDQWCVYEPIGQEEAIENIDTASKFGTGNISSDINWSANALEKLERVPVFAREIVKLGVEQYATENDIDEITPEVMYQAAPKKPPMFGQPDKEVVGGDKAKEISWDEDARSRVDNAPDFVRPGILKLMPKRAKERGLDKIDTKFLSEIRDESMMLVTRRMKGLGVENLGMEALDKARDKMSKDQKKSSVINQIQTFLGERTEINKNIIDKFGSFFSDDVGEKMGWTEEARERISRAPEFVRDMAKKSIEKRARAKGYKYVTLQAMEEAMEGMPFGSFGSSNDDSRK